MKKIGRRGIIILGVIGILLLSICNHFFVFYFHDKQFEDAVRKYAIGGSLFVDLEGRPYQQYHTRKEPLKGVISRKRINDICFMSLSLSVCDIRDIRDIKKFKNLDNFGLGYDEIYYSGKKINMPKNIDSLSALKRLETVFFSDLNIKASEFENECKNVNRMILMRCFVDDYGFIEKFPCVESLVIDGMEISSMEFVKQLNSLEHLQLSDNQFRCSLEPLMSCPSLNELSVWSDTEEVFYKIPPLNTVKELKLKGAGAPDKDNVAQFLEWENLERLALNDGYYNVKTKEWHDYERD